MGVAIVHFHHNDVHFGKVHVHPKSSADGAEPKDDAHEAPRAFSARGWVPFRFAQACDTEGM